MVTVNVEEEGGDIKRLQMTGHADYSPGNDIVCAACSALVFALLAFMEHEPSHTLEVTELVCEKGEVRLEVKGDAAFAAAFKTVVYGLTEIAKKYRNHVQLIRT